MERVSLCMIVRNEERCIKRCLESAAPFVDEIIIVDTGSTDNTKKICYEYGAELYDFNWEDDFSKARNFAVEKTFGPWILWMDADEELCVSDMAGLKNLLCTAKHSFLSLDIIHFYGEEPANLNKSYHSAGFRLFRKKENHYFTGEIHERLNVLEEEIGVDMNLTKFAYIKHYGYMDSFYKNKSDRNLNILLNLKANKPDDPWLDYHLAVEYYRKCQPEKAFLAVNNAIIKFLIKGYVPHSLAYKLKYEILISEGTLNQQSLNIEKAIEIYPDYVDLHFSKGRILYGMEKYEEAIASFRHCLDIGETNPRYLVMSGSGSFFSLYYIGLCYEKLNRVQEACKAYKNAVLIYPDFRDASDRLDALIETSCNMLS